ncbi:hypothetical protein BFP72_11420 [Reichenbachiella sp. 5M10]|uniref:hypothetical protein n=1 Tax=Reichenbachiella sp. 5M10 TaxID=1889772 RepID=UPI000C15D216|nr:hypothetical protein [Reichenbachiella sp. 5M10]PIB35960.1 hypothetical protein BFP72_11420 [Reichenbachiella sp. 5M10]
MPAFLFVLLLPFFALGQNTPKETYGIKNPGKNTANKCGDYLSIYNKLPADIRYGIEVVDRMIYFYYPSEHYFHDIFPKNTDGIAIDIVKRQQYRCYDKNNLQDTWLNQGYLMPPLYKDEMMKRLTVNEQGFVIIPYATIPQQFDPLMIECNLLILQKKYLCGYHSFSNMDYSNWGILKMGMYRDSLSADQYQTIHQEISKNLHFIVPFARNKASFDKQDIQPLYDSLHLSDYHIKEISIKAYTSIEGSHDRNIELQQGRSQSIISALQSYQSPTIRSTVSAHENWVEFLNNIRDTQFEYLSRQSKEEIKAQLSDPQLLAQLEPMLQHHRKALIELKLQKRFSSEENNPDILKKFFDQNIQNKNIEEALYLQKIIFEKIEDQQLPDDFIGQLEVPEESIYGPLLNNFAIHQTEHEDLFLYDNILRFEQLLSLMPDNLKIKYNLTTLKIKAWTQGELITNREEVQQSIDELEKLGLEQSLIKRLRINYFIILTEYYYKQQDFTNKNRALREVYWFYSRMDLSDQDLLSLSKYLAVFSKFDWAEAVLSKRIHEIDVDEDLIFYYLALTIANPNKTAQNDYRTFMLNAIDKNNQRFCDLFLPKPQGGYTFQLLNDNYLKKTYCENCKQ